MKLGILYYSGSKFTDIQKVPVIDKEIINNINIFIQSNTDIQNLHSLDDLEKDVVWVSNIDVPSWNKYYGINIISNNWLNPCIDVLSNRIGTSLPTDIDLIFKLIQNLINLIEKINQKRISFTDSLITQIFFDPQPEYKLKDSLCSEVKRFFVDKVYEGINFPISLQSNKEYRKFDVHSEHIIHILLSTSYPMMDKWKKVNYNDSNIIDYDFNIFAIDPQSIKLINSDKSLYVLDALKHNILKPKRDDGLIWINNHEYEIIKKYYEFKVISAYGNSNSCKLDIGIEYNKLDYLSFTKNWLAYLLLQKLMACNSNLLVIWAKTILFKELFHKVENIFNSNIDIAFFDFQSFHLQFEPNNLEKCIYISLENDLEPNASLFR